MQTTETLEWTAPPPSGVSLSGFKFSYRGGSLEWRLLHGIDPDAVVRMTDVCAVEDCLHTLQQGCLDNEKNLSSKNCIQVFRLLQLAIEYVWHLRNAHTALLEAYNNAVNAAARWKAGANQYLDLGSTFVSQCMATGDIPLDTLDKVDAARLRLETLDRLYNQALDKLEDEDQRARYFHFRRQRSELQWQQLCSVDLDALVLNTDTKQLDKVLPSLVFGDITSEDREELTPHHFSQLIPLAQAALDYMMFQANATGSALERAMVSLQGVCQEIPALTSATQQLHTRMTNFVLEAQTQAAQLTTSLTAPGQQPSAFVHPQGAVFDPVTGMVVGGLQDGMQGVGLRPVSLVSPAMAPGLAQGSTMVMQAPRFASVQNVSTQSLQRSPGSPTTVQAGGGTALRPLLYRNLSAAMSVQPGSPNSVGSGTAGSGAGMMIPAVWQGSAPGALSYREALALAATTPASAPVLEMQAKAVEMHFRMESLESDIRGERTKTEEMKRMLVDIRDRVLAAGTPPVATEGAGPFSSQAGGAAAAAAARARMPSTSGQFDPLRGAAASADLSSRFAGQADPKTRVLRQRTRGHRATQSQIPSQAGADLLVGAEDVVGDGSSGGSGLTQLASAPAPGVLGRDRPATSTAGKSRMGRGAHRRTLSTSRTAAGASTAGGAGPSGTGATPGVGAGARSGAETTPQPSPQPSVNNFGLSSDLDEAAFAQGRT